ncbi:histidine phosphatase superfamily [Baffinella frigidus]|nr:histidine phosphatase superfamily [Cryptophyta sp. CCMP2293]
MAVRAHGVLGSGPLVLLVRHGISVANVHKDQFGGDTAHARFRDACLSPAGRRQAEDLSCPIAAFSPDLILVSPLRRTLQTVLHALEAAPHAPPIVAFPFLFEAAGEGTENDGREVGEIATDPELPCFVHWPRVDLSQVPEGAWWEEERRRNLERGGRKRQAEDIAAWVTGRREQRIAIFTHWGTIEAVSGRGVSNGGPAIEYVFATPEMGVSSRKWAWTHVRKRD